MSHDVVIVGAGLAGGLLALRLKRLHPGIDLALVEAGPRAGGEHTWSFHETDVDAETLAWLEPMATCSWSAHEVSFPSFRRTLGGRYLSISSRRFSEVVASTLQGALRSGCSVSSIDSTGVGIGQGRLDARCVVDARGFAPHASLDLAYQKFLGIEVELSAAHALSGPCLMDATVPQENAFHFVYVLPFSDRTALIEDTWYSDDSRVDPAQRRRAVREYAARRGWRILREVREESGVLPLTLAGNIERYWADRDPGVACVGMRALLFHPTTGYSLPWAARIASEIAERFPLDGSALAAWVRARSRRHWTDTRFLRFLNRLLFRAAEPTERYRVLEHFYRQSEDVIARFYAGRLTALDRARILSGRPPVNLARAARQLFSSDTVPAGR